MSWRLRYVPWAFVCVVVVLFVSGSSAEASGGALKITRFSLQTTRTIEVPGTREKLEKAKREGSPAKFPHDNFGFVNEPYSFTQAAGHPDGLTAKIDFESQELGGQGPTPTRDPKDVAVTLPAGLLGNPTIGERCQLSVILTGEQCGPGSQLGVAVIFLAHGEGIVAPIINVVPEPGQSAEFAIETIHKIGVLLTAHVVNSENRLTGRREYAVAVSGNGLPSDEVTATEMTFWGVPAAGSHDTERGLSCTRVFNPTSEWFCGAINNKSGKLFGYGVEESKVAEVPFLTMPSNCAAGSETASLRADSIEEPGRYVEARAEEPLPTILSGPQTGFTGCSLLAFESGIEVKPDTLLADEPVDLGVSVTVPQLERVGTPATPPLRDASVTLPLGMSVNPSTVNGVAACNESGSEGIDFTGPESEEIGPSGQPQLAPGHCPDASIVGRVKATTPLLSEPVEGHIYLARPGCGGPSQAACTEQDALDGNLYKLYLELGGKGALGRAGVEIKLEGRTQADPATGQLTTRFDDNPQFPFSKLEVALEGGQQAPLANPPACGRVVTTADFTPWSAPGRTPEGLLMTGTPDATPSSFFDVEGCTSPKPFSPGFLAGTITPNAGRFTSFTLNLTRKDREQYVKGVQVHTPPGLLGVLASVPLCGETEANAGTCPEASKIGTTRVASGAGETPFEIEGSMYLTHTYCGPPPATSSQCAPFGLSVVTNAVAGPFNLGKVVVRARIYVDPQDSTLTIATDERGPYAVPQIIFGVPLRLQRITVDVNRPGFMLNPTNCAAQEIAADISGSEDAVATVSSSFAAGGCRSLAFRPSFTAFTNGRTSRKQGASLDTRLSYPKDAMGKDANIARVKVSLPKQLPSYLPTLQKACAASTFESDPAACPTASVVGIVRARTPLLPVELNGPVYFVSHGGEEFPSLIIVLQGDGVRVDLPGATFIRKGVTSSTFKTIPDVPVNTFELYLPQGRNHALAANGNLCRQAGKLVMPTEFVAQNGAVLRQSTRIKVVGCGKPKKRKKGRAGR